MQTRSLGDWLATARTPRMLAVLVLLLAAAAVCVRLGAWQLDRAQQRGEQAVAARAQEAMPPVPLDDVLAPQAGLTQAVAGRRVVVEGEYDPGAVVVVPGRDLGDVAGTLVVAGLRVDDGTGAGAILPVVRGWVEADAASVAERVRGGGDLAPPLGPVRLIGALAASEASLDGDLPDGAIGSVSSGQLVNLWGGPIYNAHVRLASSEPPEPAALRSVPDPVRPGAGLALQNVAYAAQWWIFGGFAVILWLRLVRDEAGRHPRVIVPAE